jgi:hypothetical protein
MTTDLAMSCSNKTGLLVLGPDYSHLLIDSNSAMISSSRRM